MTVNAPEEPSFTIEKQQRVKGEAAYTTAELPGKIGQVVEYKIIVKNTGNMKIKFGALKDTGCESMPPNSSRGTGRVMHSTTAVPRSPYASMR